MEKRRSHVPGMSRLGGAATLQMRHVMERSRAVAQVKRLPGPTARWDWSSWRQERGQQTLVLTGSLADAVTLEGAGLHVDDVRGRGSVPDQHLVTDGLVWSFYYITFRSLFFFDGLFLGV